MKNRIRYVLHAIGPRAEVSYFQKGKRLPHVIKHFPHFVTKKEIFDVGESDELLLGEGWTASVKYNYFNKEEAQMLE